MQIRLIPLEMFTLLVSILTVVGLEIKFQMLRVIYYIPAHLGILISTWDKPFVVISAYLAAFLIGGMMIGGLFGYVVHVKIRRTRYYQQRHSDAAPRRRKRSPGRPRKQDQFANVSY